MFIKINDREFVNLNSCRAVKIAGSGDSWYIGFHYDRENKHRLSGYKSKKEASEVLDEIWDAYRKKEHLWEPHPNNLLNARLNGKWIAENAAIETFLEVLKEIGIEQVKALELIVNCIPLVSTKEDPERAQRKVGDYYIVSGHNTMTKKKILDEIADKLGIEMLVIANPLSSR